MNNRAKELINDSIKKLPEKLKTEIQNEYDTKVKRVEEYARQEENKTERRKIIIQIIQAYLGIIDKTDIANKKLIKIYKKRELGNIGLAGIDEDYTFLNPDPEELIRKVERNGPDVPYKKIAELLKNIFDGNSELSKFVPEGIMRGEATDPGTWNDSFKYWQIYVTLIENFLKPKVNLDILRSVDGLSKYRSKPFDIRNLMLFEIKKKEKKDKKKEKKGGQPPFRRFGRNRERDRRDRRDRDNRDRRNRKNFEKRDIERRPNRRNFDNRNEKYKETMRKVKYSIAISNANANKNMEKQRTNLWINSKSSLEKALKNKLKTENMKIGFNPLSVKDPITGIVYDEEDVKMFVSEKAVTNLILKIIQLFRGIKKEERDTKIDDLMKKEGKNALDPRKKKELQGFIKSGLIDDSEDVKYYQKDISAREVWDEKFRKNAKRYLIERGIKNDYSIFVINFIEDMNTEEIKRFAELRESTIRFLMGYYGYSAKVISKFISLLKDKFDLTNKDIGKNINVNKINRINKTVNINENNEEREKERLLEKANEKEKKIIEKIDAIIARLPPNSASREKFIKKRGEVIDVIIENIKKRIKKNEEKEKRNIREKNRNKKDFRDRNRNRNRNRRDFRKEIPEEEEEVEEEEEEEEENDEEIENENEEEEL